MEILGWGCARTKLLLLGFESAEDHGAMALASLKHTEYLDHFSPLLRERWRCFRTKQTSGILATNTSCLEISLEWDPLLIIPWSC